MGVLLILVSKLPKVATDKETCNTMLSFMPTEMLELFFRFTTMGMLIVLGILVVKRNERFKAILLVSLILCLWAYILLTAPFPEDFFGKLRGPLLLFTETMPYLIWCLAMMSLCDNFNPQQWPTLLKVALVSLFIWFGYFFGLKQGAGIFHQINHGIEVLLMLHIVLIALLELKDDVVNSRRMLRMLLIIYIGLHTLMLVILELTDVTFRGTYQFGLLNAVLICFTILTFALFNLKNTINNLQSKTVMGNSKELQEENKVLPPHYQKASDKLKKLMDEGYYTQIDLTVQSLASVISLPEHQLRELINKHLRFRNFSTFLNSYRIPAACEALKDTQQNRKPILTLALELGYGSIGPFNRAFKIQLGQTPSEFRYHFQNR
jgi:AraC-like DNA-binding protein